ncbi:H-NS histone family protein [Chitinasiproducens palmae]|uniref:H-NS family DNA-binding protein n=1 Tax=Chitinasiproducens palmae TaxID=1770053 RepID=A0A1H2PR98_9BURK|nr:H-NS histone family protein [Chitinasiproducens palmae]SDV48584.1 H-NS family DNA-binding protein [Chitinasiproducens palmae]
MPSYKELLAQREELEKQIEAARSKEFDTVVADIKQKIEFYGITAADLGMGAKSKTAEKRPRNSVAPKYRDPKSGATWSGRGKPPRWIAGKNRDEYTI